MKISKIALAIALVGVLACGKDSGKEKEKEVVNALQDSKKKSSKLLVTQIATQAYTQWSVTTGKECPESLSELSNYMNRKDFKDSWGNQVVMVCGDSAPQEVVTGFGVMSKGPDGKQGTADDIKSW